MSAKLHRNASIRPWTRSAVEQAHTGTNALAQMTNVDVILHSESRTLGLTLRLSVTIVVVPGLHILRIESHLRESRHDIFLRVQARGSCRNQLHTSAATRGGRNWPLTSNRIAPRGAR